MGNYNLTNRVGGQIREKIDLGLSRIDLASSVNSENLGQLFPELTFNPVSSL